MLIISGHLPLPMNTKTLSYGFYTLLLGGVAWYGLSHDYLLIPVKNQKPVPLDGGDAYFASVGILIGAAIMLWNMLAVAGKADALLKPDRRRFWLVALAWFIFGLGFCHHLSMRGEPADEAADWSHWVFPLCTSLFMGALGGWVTERSIEIALNKREGKKAADKSYRSTATGGCILGIALLLLGLYLSWLFGGMGRLPIVLFAFFGLLAFGLSMWGGRLLGKYHRAELTNPANNLRPMWRAQKIGMLGAIAAALLIAFVAHELAPLPPPPPDQEIGTDLVEGAKAPDWAFSVTGFAASATESNVIQRLQDKGFTPDCYDAGNDKANLAAGITRLCEMHVKTAFGGRVQFVVFAFGVHGLVNYRMFYPGDQWERVQAQTRQDLPWHKAHTDKYGKPVFQAQTVNSVWTVNQPAAPWSSFTLMWQGQP
ncbi:hypothetical protein [Silvimonas iriomotensis]|uniref:Uncharacterized protein n=1 Tax=Silvimonas iriomotensis TaxID=449662 RepID=A0ABQ2PEV3_9NEIS|nr:hypothetical protein [Silvimonas iriomotensis]GGP23784.1 hypothetical protein GCM10010970_37840 [Silvimonas iriomotensis]